MSGYARQILNISIYFPNALADRVCRYNIAPRICNEFASKFKQLIPILKDSGEGWGEV